MKHVSSRFDTSLSIRGVNRSTLLGLKNERIFTQHVFHFHSQTILEVNKIFVHFHCLSLYRNDVYRNDLYRSDRFPRHSPFNNKKTKQITWLLYHCPNFPHLHYCLYLEINFQRKYQRNN